MIISSNREPNLEEFHALVNTATNRLNDDAKSKASYYITRGAQKLEDDVLGFLDDSAKGTKFEGTIEKISGQRFPDIVAAKYYGVEVKSSKDEKWISLGGSVNESTRVESVERIFLTFGKLTDPVEFRSRPYEDCLSEVVVTHYPRYKIDMNLSKGSTIFDKMNTTYDDLRFSQNPVGAIVKYYKRQLADGESLWWTGENLRIEQSELNFAKIRLWDTLSSGEQVNLKVSGMALFPELFGDSLNKYKRYTLWLTATHNVVSPSLRDSFSAGGRVIVPSLRNHGAIPRVLVNSSLFQREITEFLYNEQDEVLCETWNVSKIYSNRLEQWVNLMPISAKYQKKEFPIRQIISEIFQV
ncbi:MAG: hypothetical protein FWE29_05815 [Defluviitaleaceae bacterium]|nr:hypothetical protein [Defluviitaleaceae bacterium]